MVFKIQELDYLSNGFLLSSRAMNPFEIPLSTGTLKS